MAAAGYLFMKQIRDYVSARFSVEISERCIQLWRKKHPLAFPTTPEEFDPWFEARMDEMRARNLKRMSKRGRT